MTATAEQQQQSAVTPAMSAGRTVQVIDLPEVPDLPVWEDRHCPGCGFQEPHHQGFCPWRW